MPKNGFVKLKYYKKYRVAIKSNFALGTKQWDYSTKQLWQRDRTIGKKPCLKGRTR
jgi:hypothetical protein